MARPFRSTTWALLLMASAFSSLGPAIDAQTPNSAASPTLRVAVVGQALIKTDLRRAAPVAVEQARRYLQGADVRFTNLETAVVPWEAAVTPPRASTQGATVILNWNAPSTGAAPTTYIVQASSTAGGPPNLANFATGNTATTLTASGVPAGTYYIHILAANDAGAGPPSNEFQVTVSTNCTAAPNAPSNFGWTRTQGIVSLYWSPPVGGDDVSSYLIEAGSAPGLADSAVIDTGSVVTNLLAMIRNGSIYYVRVRAKNACGISGASNEVTVSRP